MSLAIEALRQVHEINDLQVNGVTFRDLDIKTALVIPDTDTGIEIELRFQRMTTSEKGTIWYTFAVESIADERWTTHCEGRIAANHNIPKSPRKLVSPVDLSKLTQRTSGKRWYEAFHRVGFEYGPTFQPLNQIRTNGKDHDAAANVQITTESGLMEGESRYILHPLTIDACLQLIIISINAGLHKEMACGVVPLQMEEVNLWFPGEAAGSRGHAVAWTDELDGRYFNTHTKLATESGEVVLDVRSLRCVAYEAAVPQVAAPVRKREPYMEVSWKPDITSMTPSQALQAYPDIQSETDSIGKVVELFHHKSPLGSVLVLGTPIQEVIEALGEYIPLSASFTVGDTSAEQLDHFQSNNKDDRISTLLLPQDISEWNESIIKSQDFLIVGKSIHESYPEVGLLSRLKTFMSTKGKMISSVGSEDGDGFTKKLALSSFSRPELRFDLPDTSIILSSAAPYQNGVAHPPNDLAIVTLDQKKPLLHELARLLKERDCNVNITELSGVDTSNSTKIIIYDIEGDMLSALNAETFESLKTILCSGMPIVWLTAGVNQGKTIPGGMSQGFLRAIRSEQAAARITLLDVDTDESHQSIAETLLGKLDTVATKDSGADTEFWLHKGILQIGRILPNDTLNERSSKVHSPAEETLLPAETSLRGKVVDGELRFYRKVPVDLSDSEVELQVSASEFRLSDLQSNNERPRIVVGKIHKVGNDVDSAMIGQNVVAYTKDAYSTIVKVTKDLAISFSGFEASELAATLPNLCRAVDCTVKTGKIHSQEHALLLPMSIPVLGAIVGLSRALGFKLTVVVETKEDKEECLSKYQIDADSIFLKEEIEAIENLLSNSTGEKPSLAIASDFSAFSQEIWRFMPAMSRFVLNDGVFEEALDALPFTRGVSFLSTGIDTIHRRNPSATAELLRSTLDLLKKHKGSLIKKAATFDVGLLKETKTITEGSTYNENAVIAYNYNESSVKVCKDPPNLM